MPRDLSSDPQVVLRRGGAGTNAFGLYLDYVVFDPTNGSFVRQERYFLVDNMLCKYIRTKGNKRAAWKPFPLPDHDEARRLLERNLKRYQRESDTVSIEMQHVPLLVELSSVDIAAIKKQESPMARHEGTRVTEKAVGKVDDDTWKAGAIT